MGTGTLTLTPLWNHLQSQTSRFAQGVCGGLCFRSVCFCSWQPSWADDFSYSSLEWLSQQQIISSVAHLFWQDLSTEMALLRLAKKRVQRNESAIEKRVELRGSLCELHTWTDAQHLPLECYFSRSDVCPLAHYPCLTRVDSVRLVSLSLCSAKIKKQMHKLNTPLSFCMQLLDIYKKRWEWLPRAHPYIDLHGNNPLFRARSFSRHHGSSQRRCMRVEEAAVG